MKTAVVYILFLLFPGGVDELGPFKEKKECKDFRNKIILRYVIEDLEPPVGLCERSPFIIEDKDKDEGSE